MKFLFYVSESIHYLHPKILEIVPVKINEFNSLKENLLVGPIPVEILILCFHILNQNVENNQEHAIKKLG